MLAVDLRPANLTFRMMRRRRWRRWSLAIGVSLCPLAIVLFLDWFQRTDLRKRQDQKADVEMQLAIARERFKSASTEADHLLAQLQRADALRSKRAWSDLLAVVGAALPHDGWLTVLSTEPAQPSGVPAQPAPSAPPPASATTGVQPAPTPLMIEAPRELRLSGYAATPAEPSLFVASLKGANVFRVVELIQCRQEPVHNGSYYRFDVLCKW